MSKTSQRKISAKQRMEAFYIAGKLGNDWPAPTANRKESFAYRKGILEYNRRLLLRTLTHNAEITGADRRPG